MPPKRKAKAEGSPTKENLGTDPLGPASEVPKQDGLPASSIQWQWAERKEWFIFPKDAQKIISEAYKEKDNEVTLASGVLMFEKQKIKKKSGWHQKVRATVQSTGTGEFYCWSWNEGRKQSFYHLSSQQALENAHNKGLSKVTVKAGETNTVVTLSTMTQSNGATVTREKADGKRVMTLTPDPGVPSRSRSSIAADDDVVSVPTATKSKRRATAAFAEGDDPSLEPQTKKVIVKGKAPVDSECREKSGKAHVYFEGDEVFDCMLNQTNLQNNNNKYYIVQLLEDDRTKNYCVWTRWGRVGNVGQNALFPCGPDLEEAKIIYTKKFQDKTRNKWENRLSFVHHAGKYDLLQMDYGSLGDATDATAGKKSKTNMKSKLSPALLALMELLFNMKSMEATVHEMKYDSRKSPLGKLSAKQIRTGYSSLKLISDLVDSKNYGSALTDACNQFYTGIPHNFGMSTPPRINTKELVKAKMNLLGALEDIVIAVSMMNRASKKDEHPGDSRYKELDCKLAPVSPTAKDFTMVQSYLKCNHAATHSHYTLQLDSLFTCDKPGEAQRFKDHGNRMLLWHGSRMSNWAGILGSGLRIAPKEAPVTGYMFGKGLYFADMASKSANYCHATPDHPYGLLALSEVSLGKPHVLNTALYTACDLPPEHHSVKGCGIVTPTESMHQTLVGGTVVPIGLPQKDSKKDARSGYTLNYNEYVVYDTAQVKLKYLCKVKFVFKR